MNLTLIAAVARNGVIGNGNAIPWHVPADFKHFSATTKGNVVVMGSKTWHSLPDRFRPLPHRENVVVSSREIPRTQKTANATTRFLPTLERACETARLIAGPKPIFIIGGASIYEQTIDRADRLLISSIPLEPEGDTFFPEIGAEWHLVASTEMDGFTLKDYRRS